MQIDVVNQQNEKVGSLDLRDEVFGGRVKTDLIHESVVRANAAERRGTHATKTRAMVSGSGKKPWRQKGTGRARVGEIRNPLWRKGGTVFGPQPRSYDYQLPKKVEKGALRAALTQKLRDGEVTVVDALSVARDQDEGGGRDAEGGSASTGKALLVDVKPEDKLSLSVRNIEGVRLLPSNRVSARDVMDTRRVVLTRAALEKLQEALGERHETDRRHPAPAHHREDDGHPRGRPDAGVPGGDGRQQDRHQARRRAAARLEGRRASARRWRTASSSARASSSAAARTGRRRT